MTVHKLTELERILFTILFTVASGVASMTCYKANKVMDKIDMLATHDGTQDGKLEAHEKHFDFVEKEIAEVKERISSRGRAIVQLKPNAETE